MLKALQDTYSPDNICFGCGPANPRGLQIKSYARGDEVVAEFTPEEHHQAFSGVVNGGIIGTVLDCHMNWTAAYALMNETGTATIPPTVTAEFSVKLRRPTPAGEALRLAAHVVSIVGNKAEVEATVEALGEVTARGKGTFVAVGEDHPAAERW
ncbi:MAG: PaaI family thioesterase [Acidimicrobiia bacterium]|nr:PaaI family thioesterase [Acidimicrobiia bacterium]